MKFTKVDDSRTFRKNENNSGKIIKYEGTIDENSKYVECSLEAKKNAYIANNLNKLLYTSLAKKVEKTKNKDTKANQMLSILKQISVDKNDKVYMSDKNIAKIKSIYDSVIKSGKNLDCVLATFSKDDNHFGFIKNAIRDICLNSNNQTFQLKFDLSAEKLINYCYHEEDTDVSFYYKRKNQIEKKANIIIDSIAYNSIAVRDIEKIFTEYENQNKDIKKDDSIEKKIEKLLDIYQIEKLIASIKVFFCDEKALEDKESNNIENIAFLDIVEDHIKYNKIDDNYKFRDKENQFLDKKSGKVKEKQQLIRNKIIKKIFFTFQLNSIEIKQAWEKQKDQHEKTPLKYIDDFVKEYLDKHFPIKNTKSRWSLDDLNKDKIFYFCKCRYYNKRTTSNILKSRIKESDSGQIFNSIDLEKNHIDNVLQRKMSAIIAYAGNDYNSKIVEKLKKIYKTDLEEQLSEIEVKMQSIPAFIDEKGSEVKIFDGKINKYKKDLDSKMKVMEVYKNYLKDDFVSTGIKENCKIVKEEVNLLEKKKDEILSYLEDSLSKIDNEISRKDILGKNKTKLEEYIARLSETNQILFKQSIFERRCIFAIRNTNIHFKRKLDTTILEKSDNQEIKTNILSEYRNKISELPSIAISNAYDNNVINTWGLEKTVEFLSDNNLFYVAKENKCPSFKRLVNYCKDMNVAIDKGKLKRDKVELPNLIIEIANLHKQNSSTIQYKNYMMKLLYYGKSEELAKGLKSYINKSLKDYKLEEQLKKFDFQNISTNQAMYDKFLQIDDLDTLKEYVQRVKSYLQLEEGKEFKALDKLEIEVVSNKFLNDYKKQIECILKSEDVENKKLNKDDILDVFSEGLENASYNISIPKFNELTENSNEIMFISLLKYLSKRRLSELLQNLLSYKVHRNKFNMNGKIYGAFDLDILIEMTQIYMITYNNTSINDVDEEKYVNMLNGFLEKNFKEYNKIFSQNGENERKILYADEENPVKFYQIIEADRENILDKYKDYYENHKISYEEVTRFNELEKEVAIALDKKNNIKIEVIKASKNLYKVSKSIKKLEERKAGYREKNEIEEKRLSKEKNIKTIKTIKNSIKLLKKEYTDEYKKILEYNRLKNRILFTDVRKMNSLLCDLYGKFNGLIAIYEKNLYYSLSDEDKRKVDDAVNRDNMFDFIKKKKDSWHKENIESNNGKNKENCPYGNIMLDENDYSNRNKFAHFDYLTGNDKDNDNFACQLNKLRKLLRGDRKLKNIVTKVVIATFEKHGLQIDMKFNNNHEIYRMQVERMEMQDEYLNHFEVVKIEDCFLEMIKEVLKI